MTRLKQLAALTVLSGSLIAPAIALAEPTPPPGTTVNTVPLTSVQTNVSAMDAPSIGSSSNSMMNNGSNMNQGNMGMRNSGMPSNNMGMPMTDMSDSNSDDPSVNNNAGMTPTP